MAVKTKIRAAKRARRERDAAAFAAHIEEQAATCEWTRLLYAVEPTQVGRKTA
jgi:hypothetical protein